MSGDHGEERIIRMPLLEDILRSDDPYTVFQPIVTLMLARSDAMVFNTVADRASDPCSVISRDMQAVRDR